MRTPTRVSARLLDTKDHGYRIRAYGSPRDQNWGLLWIGSSKTDPNLSQSCYRGSIMNCFFDSWWWSPGRKLKAAETEPLLIVSQQTSLVSIWKGRCSRRETWSGDFPGTVGTVHIPQSARLSVPLSHPWAMTEQDLLLLLMKYILHDLIYSKTLGIMEVEKKNIYIYIYVYRVMQDSYNQQCSESPTAIWVPCSPRPGIRAATTHQSHRKNRSSLFRRPWRPLWDPLEDSRGLEA